MTNIIPQETVQFLASVFVSLHVAILAVIWASPLLREVAISRKRKGDVLQLTALYTLVLFMAVNGLTIEMLANITPVATYSLAGAIVIVYILLHAGFKISVPEGWRKRLQ